MEKRVLVSVTGFSGLFDRTKQTIVPEYQRPYVWNKEKVNDLLNDLDEHFIQKKNQGNYYLGGVLLFFNQKDGVYEIVDGQQRITTLLILQSILAGGLPKDRNVEFNSSLSFSHIKDIQRHFTESIDVLEKLNGKGLFERLEFTKIVTYSEDEAFTFFDTQNNRGVPLSATDFLKAYHLRAILQEQLQEKSAVNWENIENSSFRNQFLDFLFERMLWRVRNWKGNYIPNENKDKVLDTFQKKTLQSDSTDGYPLFASVNNQGFHRINWDENGDRQLVSVKNLNSTVLNLPLSLRTPIYRGLNFFDYTQKYSQLFNHLFVERHDPDSPIGHMRSYYDSVYTDDMSGYLRDFMQLLLVVFCDSFGEEKLPIAINHFDFILGSKRLMLGQVKKEAVQKYLREEKTNLLDEISGAYQAAEIFNLIKNQHHLAEPYRKFDKNKEGVQKRYMVRMLKHFSKDKSELKNRAQWLQ